MGSGLAAAKLTMGPVLFNWAPEKLRDFYFRLADEAPVDSVCVGEVVCSKRTPFFVPYVAEVTARLERAGKEVIHSTLALVMTGRELAQLAETAGSAELLVEANDISAHALLAGRQHVIGPLVNVYNEGTLKTLAGRGAFRVCLASELPAPTLAVLGRTGLAELEVQIFGRLPLALSARCYHARAKGLTKDNCQYVCAADPDGMAVETLDGKPFLAVNGTQTLSHTYCNRLGELQALEAMGIRRFRLSPQDVDMVAVAGVVRGLLDGVESVADAQGRLAGLTGGVPFSNGFFHGREGARFVETALP